MTYKIPTIPLVEHKPYVDLDYNDTVDAALACRACLNSTDGKIMLVCIGTGALIGTIAGSPSGGGAVAGFFLGGIAGGFVGTLICSAKNSSSKEKKIKITEDKKVKLHKKSKSDHKVKNDIPKNMAQVKA